MPTLSSYEYAWIRIVPRVEMGEFLNIGVVLFCRTRRFMELRIVCSMERIAAYAYCLDAAMIEEHLGVLLATSKGEGPIGKLGKAETFHWLVAPHSTVIQASPVHSGLSEDPAATLDHLASLLRCGE